MDKNKTVEQILSHRLVAILRGLEGDAAVQTASALYAGGIRLVEVTFDQRHPEHFAHTAEAIARISRAHGGVVLAGAGTVLTPQQVDLAADAGARYIISPDCCEAVIRRTLERGLVSLPGALTATEVMAAHRMGADFVKVFPAGSLGSGYLKALCAPLAHVRLVAVGGVDAGNAKGFLQAGAVGLGVGGRLVDKALVAAGRYDEITAGARALVESIQ